MYADVALLRQDRATLREVVPRGCGLFGLRTVYGGVHATFPTARPPAASAAARQVVLSVRASLAGARLVCPHRSTVALAARTPVAMTIVLWRVGGQLLIGAIRVPA